METAVQTCYRHPDQPAGVICQRCDRPICPRCMHQASVGFHCPECTKQGKQKVYQGIGSLRVRPILTQVLIAINVAVFLVGVAVDGSGAIGGDSGRMQIDFGLIAKAFDRGQFIGVGEGEWYRLVTAGFLHYGLIHLLLNMYALWILGNAVENLGGRLRFGVIYGVSLLAGAFGALVLSPGSLTAGASGAIFGLMGAIFLAQRAQGIGFRDSPLLWVLLLNLAFTFGIPGISIGGHLGGLVGGAAAGWILFDYGQRPGVDKRLPLAACGAFAVLCVVGSVLFANGWMP
ncbi:rhomboid family intramembrane serine protease [Aquihabitans sp. G128]|uniref:rhomboid family intramembrane serine protease n=1 Tax=Aquihabitans sp. G128 TaxID=2849779 RepID=UPI001C213B85|nr:rhomboid family intramembrane serine protease [Aquihabitans sp. G128]QXC63131.1 rhomboid family intramembrane serine protease [Aquihabitans sp. G128]